MSGLWGRLPFIGRLLVTASTAILVAGAAMVLVSVRQEVAEIRSDLKVELGKELDTLPAALAETVVIGDFSTLQQTLDRYVARPLIVSAQFKDTSGVMVSSSAPPLPSAAPAWFITLFDFSDVDGQSPAIVGGRRYGDLQLVLSAQRLSERAWRHLKSHMGILLLAILVDFIGIWLVLRSGLAPLKQLEEGAQAVAAGRFDIQLVPEGSPELQVVIDAFNRMVQAVQMGQSALKESEERLAYVLAATGEGIWDWNIPADVVTHNEQWGQIIGLDEVPPSHPVEFFINCIHPEDRQAVMARVQDALANRCTYHSEHRLMSVAGQVVWVLDRGQVVERDAAGLPLRMVGSIADITDRKLREAEIANQRRRLASIIEGTNVGTWEWNLLTGEVTINQRWADIVGYRLEELQPTSLDTWIRLSHPDDLSRSNDLLQRHLAGELPYYECEVRMLHQHGHWVWVLDRGKVAIRAEDGKPILMSGTHQDITPRKEAEEALIQAKIEAESANIAKSRFLATMSHEIRTPMNGVLGMAQLLLLPAVDESERVDYARIILNSGETLLKLLNDILDLSKVEAGKIELESTFFEPAQVLNDIKALFGEAARAKAIELDTAWSGPVRQRYVGDVHRLRQMLSNLVGNAIKFTPAGRVRIEAGEKGRDATRVQLEFAVIDTGIGIPKEKQSQLFKPFSQADSSITREFSGTGLGLSIVRSLAKLMGGDVGVDSEAGQGSRFWFRIRANLVSEQEEPGRAICPQQQPSAAAARTNLLNGRILVVEDNRINRMVVSGMLGKLGVSVDMAEDGQQAVDAIKGGQRPQLVLMDVQMPVMDGYTATVQIRQWAHASEQPHLPIVALTAGAFEEDLQRCRSAGMDDFLAKPVSFEALEQVLARWLEPSGRSSGSAAPAGIQRAESGKAHDHATSETIGQ